jgi:hypothetical protein
VVILLGTVVGQKGHAAGVNPMSGSGGNPMDGMEGMGHSKSGGMNMPGMSSGSSTSSMPGMTMPGDSTSAGSTSAGSTAATTTDATKSATSASAAPMAGMDMSDPKMAGMDMSKPATTSMDMTDPKMAASMPGGLHTTCKADTCTVVFADTATGIAKVLGTTAHLEHSAGKTLTLTVGGHKLTLAQGKAVTSGKLSVKLTSSTAHTYTVTFTKSA